MTLADRFWSHVRRRQRGCWLWMGSLGDLGYGRVKVGGKLRAAHRVAYGLAHDRDIPPDTIIRQRCGERRCCRPEHLEAVKVIRLTVEQRTAIAQSRLGWRRLKLLYPISGRRIRYIRASYD